MGLSQLGYVSQKILCVRSLIRCLRLF
uniref:Uncharacterized protein n=1 Tax=Arundo donax TaxID=35708 RepID=A0A0A8Z1J3_ARUDO